MNAKAPPMAPAAGARTRCRWCWIGLLYGHYFKAPPPGQAGRRHIAFFLQKVALR